MQQTFGLSWAQWRSRFRLGQFLSREDGPRPIPDHAARCLFGGPRCSRQSAGRIHNCHSRHRGTHTVEMVQTPTSISPLAQAIKATTITI
jgi:hypothetical protein